MRGATNVYGLQKGLADDRTLHVDAQLEQLATPPIARLADAKGAGAGGGLGFALLLAGGRRVDGLGVVADAVGLAATGPVVPTW